MPQLNDIVISISIQAFECDSIEFNELLNTATCTSYSKQSTDRKKFRDPILLIIPLIL